MIFLSCPPVYYLPGTWGKCGHAIIPHGTYEGLPPQGQLAAIILILLITFTSWGVYTAFFNNKNLTDPWDDHDD